MNAGFVASTGNKSDKDDDQCQSLTPVELAVAEKIGADKHYHASAMTGSMNNLNHLNDID